MAIFLLASHHALAQVAETAEAPTATIAQPPEKVRELLGLLDDPSVKAWLQDRRTSEPPDAKPKSRLSRVITDRVTSIGDHLADIATNAPKLPIELERAGNILVMDFGERGLVEILVLLAGFVMLGFGVEWLFWRVTVRARRQIAGISLETVGNRLRAVAMRLLIGLVQVLVFAAGSVFAFLIFRWPPLLKEIVLAYLVAFIAFRAAVAMGRFLLSPDDERFRMVPMSTDAAWFWYGRLRLMAGWSSFGLGTVQLFEILEFSPVSRELVAYIFGFGLLGLALELVWRRPAALPLAAEVTTRRHRLEPGARKGLISAYFVVLWLLWVASAMPLFWLLVVALALPTVMRLVERTVNHVLRRRVRRPSCGASPGCVSSVGCVRS